MTREEGWISGGRLKDGILQEMLLKVCFSFPLLLTNDCVTKLNVSSLLTSNFANTLSMNLRPAIQIRGQKLILIFLFRNMAGTFRVAVDPQGKGEIMYFELGLMTNIYEFYIQHRSLKLQYNILT